MTSGSKRGQSDDHPRRLHNGLVIPKQRPRNVTEAQATQLADWIFSQEKRPTNLATMEWYRSQFKKRLEHDVCGSLVDSIISENVMAQHQDLKKSADSSLELPGFGLPLTHLPKRDHDDEPPAHFPILGSDEDGWKAATLLIREVCMLSAVEELTNKPEWWLKCRDPKITKKWKEEALAMDWAAIREHADFTPAMADAVMEELRHKASIYEEAGFIPVLDYSIAALKSDKILDGDLVAELKAAVAPLEDVPDDRKDWHPGSNNQVLDLVHPSLWPLVYGRTRILPNGRVGVQDALEHCGGGFVIPKPLAIEVKKEEYYSTQFQWLPSDVTISADGKAKIDSYVSNLHPVEHAQLYPVLDKLIEEALPAWDVLYRWPEEFEMQRLTVTRCGTKCSTPKLCKDNYECAPYNRPLNDGEEPRGEDEQWEDGYEESERGRIDMAWFESTHEMDLPDPDLTKLPVRVDASDFRTSGFFSSASRVQVIVKLANIHLTPESPSYAGGSWHVEGLQNEHICATALYYYDSDNISDSRLDFRTRANREDLSLEVEYEQSDERSITRTFAMDDGRTGSAMDASTTQRIGSVLTRSGRSLFFPNLYQHHVSPFELTDPTKPGHRKIVALFLVDPKIPVISTANVPPQRQDWWQEAAVFEGGKGAPLGKLPAELREMVVNEVDFPYGKAEAERIREELMEERGASVKEMDEQLATVEYSFCEH